MANVANLAKRTFHPKAQGFSLVELLIALLFISILMAGMAKVFQSSLGVFYSAGETLSSSRRNRMTMDMLYDDLNNAAMYISDLSAPPSHVSAANPAFYILPNQPVVGAGPDDPATADQIFFFMDQPLPFEGTIAPGGAQKNAAEHYQAGDDVAATVAGNATADDTFSVDCGDASYANLIKVGQSFIIKDAWETLYIKTVSVAGAIATVTVAGSPTSAVTGVGSVAAPSKFKHIPNSRVLFYTPSQMVRYSIQMRNLDPQNPGGIPCLIREQGTYSSAGFVPDPALESIITENVNGFKVYLSADSGANWAGTAVVAADFDSGWTNGIRAALNTQLATAGRTDYTTTLGNEHWFRKIPTLVRLDVTTRTSTKRAENPATPTIASYKNLTQTMVLVPRHFGLPIN